MAREREAPAPRQGRRHHPTDSGYSGHITHLLPRLVTEQGEGGHEGARGEADEEGATGSATKSATFSALTVRHQQVTSETEETRISDMKGVSKKQLIR